MVSPRSFTSSEGVFVIAPHDPALVASPSPALPASSPSAQAGPDCQGLAHLSPSPLPAHRIPPLLPSSPASPEPRLAAAARLSCLSDGFLPSSPYFLHACFVPGVRNNPAPWELHDQVGKIRRANNHFKHVQGRTRSTHTLCYVSTQVKGRRLGFGRGPRRVSARGGRPRPPSSSLKPGVCPRAVGQGHGHQRDAPPPVGPPPPRAGGRAELEAAPGSLCCSFSDEKEFATEHPECPAVREPGQRNFVMLVHHQILNRH